MNPIIEVNMTPVLLFLSVFVVYAGSWLSLKIRDEKKWAKELAKKRKQYGTDIWGQ